VQQLLSASFFATVETELGMTSFYTIRLLLIGSHLAHQNISTMERIDGWLTPEEEQIFNTNNSVWNSRFFPLLHTDDYLRAFFHVQRRYNPLIPSWTLGCNASNFVFVATEKWDHHCSMRSDITDASDKRALVIGIARRLCSLGLQMDPGCARNAGYTASAQRRGLLYPIRQSIPTEHTYAMPKFDGVDASMRLDGVELLAILAYLFAHFEVENDPDDVDAVVPYRYEPYERPPPKKLSPPERRLCSSLAYVAFNSRVCASGGGGQVKAPLCLLGEEKIDDQVPAFSVEDFAQLADLTDSKNPLRATVAYLAGKLLELKQLGIDVRP
jgi:hypothetical protein